MITIKTLNTLKCPLRSIVEGEIAPSGDTLFIVPESSKASVEREVFNFINKDGKKAVKAGKDIVTAGLFRQDVLSFIKFAQRIVSNSGDESITGFDDVMLRNVIYNILVRHGSEFRFIHRFVGKFEYIDKIIALLGDFTRYGVDPDSLEEVLSREGDSTEDFYDKVHDIKILMEYIREINDEYGFSLLESDLGRAVDFIDGALSKGDIPKRRIYSYLRELRETKIVIYGFGSYRTFTPQEMNFLKALDRLGCEMVMFVLYDSNNEEEDVFYFGKMLIDSVRREGLEFNLEAYSSLPDPTDNDVSIVTSAYAFDKSFKLGSSDGSVELVKLDNIDDSLAFVCNEIIRLTRQEGYRYRDIRVFSPSEDVTDRFKGIMRLFKLDAFIDKRMILNGTPVMRLVEIMLELPKYDYPLDMVIRLLRTGLLPVRFELVDYFENYCIMNNITFGSRIFNESRFKETKDFNMYYNGKAVTNPASYLWKSIVESVLIPLKNAADKVRNDELISSKAKDLMDYLDGLRHNLEALRDEFLSKNDSASAALLVRSYKEIMILLTSFTSELNDVTVTAEAFTSLIKTDMKNKVLATIPLTVDSIEITDTDSSCHSPCKVLFMIGCKTDNFPYSSMTDGVMSNSELIRLNSEMTIDLPDKVQTKSKEDFVKAALTVNSVSDLLYMVNVTSDLESEVFSFFNGSYEKEISYYVDFATPVYGLAVEKKHDISTSSINEEHIKGLLGEYYTGSVSSFETFNYCSLQYMLNNVLKIRERSDGTRLDVNQVGTILHSMFEDSIKKLMDEHKSGEDLKEIRNRLDDEVYMDKFAEDTFNIALAKSSIKDKDSEIYAFNLGARTRRIFKKGLPVLMDYIVESGYVPYAYEESLKLDNRLSFTTQNGIKFDFNGFIDRVDYNSDTDRYRIVDYKSGGNEIKHDELASGLQIQLFAYALLEFMQGHEVDDVSYVDVKLPHHKTEDENKTEFKYKGSGFDPNQIKELCTVLKDLLQRTCEQISIGKADALVNPAGIKGNECKYCKYRVVCGNDPNHIYRDFNDYSVSKDDCGGDKKRAVIESMRKRSEAPWNFRHNKMQ